MKEPSKKSKPALFEKFVQRVARRWVAGSSIQDALRSAKDANMNGMSAIVNYLGEHVTDDKEIQANVNEYVKILHEMERLCIRGSITPKLTQIGLDKDYKTCENNIMIIVEEAKKLNRFVWVDMESFSYINDTTEIYYALLKRYDMVGLAFQAYLKRGTNYLVDLIMKKGKIRLVKGAYSEDRNVVYHSRRMVDRNFVKLMQMLFEDSDDFAIATHDQVMIDRAMELHEKYKKKFEFQLLKGIRDDIKPFLVKRGFSVAEYIPYGKNISAYSVRRIKEKPTNILLLARSLF